MDRTPATISTFFHLFFLLSLLLARATAVDLDALDHGAFLAFQTALGITNGNGQLPHEVCHLAGVDCERRLSDAVPVLRITRLVFESMKLTGSLSPAIGKLTELKELSIQNNHLTYQLPPEIVACRKLEILNLKNNQFSGVITPELSSLIQLRVLDLSSNKFSGSLAFLKYFPNLEKLSLADNQFSGKVAVSIRSFRNLQFFNFSGNLLQGQIPLMEEIMYSSPELPKRYILAENSTTSRRNGTTASANAVAPSSKEAEAPSPPAALEKHKFSKKKKAIIWVLGFLVGIIIGSVSGFVFSVLFKLLLLWIKGGKKKPGPEVYSKQIKAEDLAFLENEDGLTSLEMIGKGACGEVYKAQLAGSDGKWIAIKKIIQQQNDPGELSEEDSRMLNKKMRQIRSEIQTVGNIRHRNLLPLLAHVAKPDCHYLVYEYMKNGSLQDALNEVSRGIKDLDWLLRFQIALGIAAGLEHLHMGNVPRIIHRDLKPANILLDDDMEARIADFGLAKAMPDAKTHMTMTNVAGTVGYIAPEYYQTFKFTEKCDIFSFGVILGSLGMGKQPSDEFFQHTSEMNLVKWLRNVMTSENPSQAIDSNLRGNGYEDQMLLVLKIACFCTLDDPQQRPNSKDVRCMLSQIEH